MTGAKDMLAGLRPNTIIDLQVHKAKDLDGKDDLRRTRILGITESFVVVEQPTQKINPKRVGSSMGLTYVKRDQHGNFVREILEAKLVKVGKFKLKHGITEALLFDYPFNMYSADLRRHFRVEIPLDEDVFVAITDLAGRPIGSEKRYRVMDLSLNGLRLSCKNRVMTKDGFTSDPLSRLSVEDEILTKIFINQQEVLWTKSAIRVKLSPGDPKTDVFYLGIEFLERVTIDDQSKKMRFYKYTDKEQRCIIPYITEFERKALKKGRKT